MPILHIYPSGKFFLPIVVKCGLSINDNNYGDNSWTTLDYKNHPSTVKWIDSFKPIFCPSCFDLGGQCSKCGIDLMFYKTEAYCPKCD